MDPAAAQHVSEGTLRLSRAPTAEIASVALKAQQRAGLDAADFIVIAVPPGRRNVIKLVADLERVAGENAE